MSAGWAVTSVCCVRCVFALGERFSLKMRTIILLLTFTDMSVQAVFVPLNNVMCVCKCVFMICITVYLCIIAATQLYTLDRHTVYHTQHINVYLSMKNVN